MRIPFFLDEMLCHWAFGLWRSEGKFLFSKRRDPLTWRLTHQNIKILHYLFMENTKLAQIAMSGATVLFLPAVFNS
jgi:hypothetical protein